MLFVGAAHPALGTLLVQPQLALLGVQLQLRVSALGKAGCGSPGREPSQPSLCFQSLEWFVYGTLWYPPCTTICTQMDPQEPGGRSKCCSQPWGLRLALSTQR